MPDTPAHPPSAARHSTATQSARRSSPAPSPSPLPSPAASLESSAPACAIRSVTVRVAGALVTDAFAHHFGTSSQRVGVRAGDVLTYVPTRPVPVAIADGFAAAAATGLRHRLRRQVSPTWVGVVPGASPPGLVVHLAEVPGVANGYQPQRSISGAAVPAHVWVRVGTVLWQVCDLVALEALAKVWADCARLLGGPAPRRGGSGTTARRNVPKTGAAHIPTAPPAAAAAGDAPAQARNQGGDDGRGARSGKAPEPAAEPAGGVVLDGAAGEDRGDAELLVAHTRGDPGALGVLIARRQRLVEHAIRRTVGVRGARDDITQTVWAQVAAHADGFAGGSEVSTWLWRIARNTALKALRRDLEPVDPATLVEHRDPHDPYRPHELRSVVEQLLTVLPPDWRAATELVDLQGYDLDTAAELLDVPRGSVASRRHRARQRMADEARRLGVTLDP